MDPQGNPSRGEQPVSPGTVLGGRYEIIEPQSESAFGVLYKAKRRADQTFVSIEILDSRLFGDQRLRGAVRREIEQLAGLDHKNLAVPLDFGDELSQRGTVTYVVYEYLDGQSLAEMHEKKRAAGKPFSLKGAYNVIAHLANGLQALHSHAGSVHGGLSMRSVHITAAGRVKVLELGVARAILLSGGKSVVAQAVPNLAPEALGSPDRVDRRADVYSTGALLYEILTGQPPTQPVAVASTIAQGITRPIDMFLDTALRIEPTNRYPDMGTLKEALQHAVGPDIAPAGAPGAVSASSQSVPKAATAPSSSAVPKIPQGASSQSIPKLPPPHASAPPPPRSASAAPMSSPGMPAAPRPVPASFNVDTALSSVDESHERWLVQKDKLDFGPFTLRDVKAQIEQGKIQGEHTIVDTENGERRRVKDHPLLREMALQADAMNAENERLRMESASRDKHRGRVVGLLAILLLVALGGGAGLFWFVQHQKAKVVIVKERSDPDFKFDVTMKVDPPEKKTPGKHRGAGKMVNGKNVFDDTTVLGDASESGGDETLDGPTVQRVMTQNFRLLTGCMMEERSRNSSLRNVDLDFIIKGSGSVQGVKVNGQTTGAFASCIYGKMQAIAFPKFNGSKTHASFSFGFK
ncbi:MAG: protein kinase [Polyangia bacterium]